jgi:glycogen synthase
VREKYKIENDVAYSITHNKPIEEIYYFRKYKTKGRKTDKPIFDANKFTQEDLSAIKILKDQIYGLEEEVENYKCFGWLSKIRKIKALR